MPRAASLLLLFTVTASAEPPVIPDGPVTIDPAQFLPLVLRAKATVEFEEASLADLVAWLRKEQGLAVVVHENEILDNAERKLSEPSYTDRLDNAPLYQLLDRLELLDLGWWRENGVLHLSSKWASEKHHRLATYPIGDLLDRGFDTDSLIQIITSVVGRNTWAEDGGGYGELRPLGSFLAVSQSDAAHRRIACLLQGLRTHGRQTWVSQPAEHETLREILGKPVSTNYDGLPLEDAVADLERQIGSAIHLDRNGLENAGLTGRTPVSSRVAGRPLRTTKLSTPFDAELVCVPYSGALVLTTDERAPLRQAIAVYDARDLWQTQGEYDCLIDAIFTLIVVQPDEQGCWHTGQGGCPSEVRPATPGAIVVLNEERAHHEFLKILELFRDTLRNHPPRDRTDARPKTVYYRLERDMAEQLAPVLPELVAPDSWGEGTKLLCVASVPLRADGGERQTDPKPHSTLIIRQTRAVHDEIRQVIQRVTHGDREQHAGFGTNRGIGGSYTVEGEGVSPDTAPVSETVR